MHRRTVLAWPLLGFVVPMTAAGQEFQRIKRGDMTFRWWHREGRLFGELSAPTAGWLAVGFNDQQTLRGTRFLIGVVEGVAALAEWHIADPPNHQPIEELGGRADIRNLRGWRDAGRSTLSFSLPHRDADRFSIDLTPGRPVHLMLAWSHEPDFAHHSAWRDHVDVVL